MEATIQKKPLTKLLRYTYGMVDLTATIYNNTANILFTYCLTNIMLFANETTLMISSIGSTVMMIVPFIIGIIVSGTPAMKWGRHRSWLLLMAPLSAIGYVFKFTRVGGSEMFAAWIVILAYIIGGIANSFCYNANGALLNVISTTEQERAGLSRNRGFATALAGVVYSYTSTPLALALAAVVGLAGGYTMMAAVVAVVNMLAMFYTVWSTKGYETSETDNAAREAAINARVPLKVMLKCLVQNRSLIGLFIADITRFSSNMLVMGTQTYFFKYCLQDMGLMTSYILWGGIFQTIGSYLSGSLSAKLSARRMLVLAEILVGVMLLGAWLLGTNAIIVFILLMVYRFAHGFSYSMFFNCYADCVVYGEWKTGMSVPGFTLSLSSVAAQFGSMIKNWLLPIILILISFDAKVDVSAVGEGVLNGIRLAFGLIPGGIRFLGVIALVMLYNLTGETVRKCEAEIAERKAA